MIICLHADWWCRTSFDWTPKRILFLKSWIGGTGQRELSISGALATPKRNALRSATCGWTVRDGGAPRQSLKGRQRNPRRTLFTGRSFRQSRRTAAPAMMVSPPRRRTRTCSTSPRSGETRRGIFLTKQESREKAGRTSPHPTGGNTEQSVFVCKPTPKQHREIMEYTPFLSEKTKSPAHSKRGNGTRTRSMFAARGICAARSTFN